MSIKLEVKEATKFYTTKSGNLHALDQFSVGIDPGDFVSIVGPSGCGKSTLLWSIAGLHDLTSGEIRLDGKKIDGPNDQIGMVFQEANMLPWRSLIKNIEFPFEIKKKAPNTARINELLKRVGLSGFETKYPRELSGGMQQRASIVRALSFDPSVLLMDEPFGALDAFTRDEMNLLVQEIWLETKKTIIFITHNIAEAVLLSSKVFVMSARPGRLANVYEIDYARPRSIEMLSDPKIIQTINQIRSNIIEQTT
ncbi:MAG: ABC transporter ATP-binding protein [Deltaproteobacteria bacterium]|jgi:NitT/TauT family transport system ATP-binding protein|nr:ABC transporter ATP-binding protein [Deltaproteobacteria bacterium]